MDTEDLADCLEQLSPAAKNHKRIGCVIPVCRLWNGESALSFT